MAVLLSLLAKSFIYPQSRMGDGTYSEDAERAQGVPLRGTTLHKQSSKNENKRTASYSQGRQHLKVYDWY